MKLEEVIKRTNLLVDELLVKIARDPVSRYLIDLPPLTAGEQKAPVMDVQEYRYAIARLREVITYKYILCALKSGILAPARESLALCLSLMRKTPVIDYYDWGDYHEFAYKCYMQTDDKKKARRHLLACYMDRGRAILSADKIFDCKELIMALMKEHQRMQSFLLYVINFIHYDFEEVQPFLKRSQYLLIERALLLATKLFAENAACDVNVRSSIYYVASRYYEQTDRMEMARSARAEYLRLGGDRNYDLELVQFLMTQPDPVFSDERFLDYILYRDSIDDDEIYPRGDDGNFHLEIAAEDPIVVKDGRSNYMDTYYRTMPAAKHFMTVYEQAERGEREAILEVIRCYRAGDGVAPCEAAARAWEEQLP